ncbi:hypothetical protein BSL78_16837 [Apostichopus japonicus]|uniref:ZMYM2-like/QRICH1 C-terminal domain-containing protein n=1 Tax=Stichopus japonicus TaxID=307972 RepID=A0A2G8KEB2_STIJA|nr:hypothetical protein BSL78_16837 [Apostichopus japonicus]
MNDLGINFELNFELESLDEDSPTPSPSNRFKELSSQEIDKIAEGKNEKATLYNTTWGVKLFKEWCTAKGKDSNFEALPHEELNCLLRVFMQRSQRKSPIAAADLKKMITALDVETPQGLLRLTWFYLEYYFCRRGREGLRLLKKDSFKFCKDDGDREFCTLAFNEATKNHPGDLRKDNETEKRMYATGNDNCPVKMLKLYLSKLNPKCEHLFQRPNSSFTKGKEQKWYNNVPVGKNTLGNMMKEISKAAN